MRYNLLQEVYFFIMASRYFGLQGVALSTSLYPLLLFKDGFNTLFVLLHDVLFLGINLSPGSSIELFATGWRFQQLSPVHVAMYRRFTPASTSELSIQMLGKLHTTLMSEDAVCFSTPH